MLSVLTANFAFDLLRETGLSESTIISPLSISIALDMILIGAKNNTAKEIQNTIAKGSNIVEIHNHFSKIYYFIKEKIKSGNVKIANKVYYAKDLQMLESYKTEIQKYFDGNFQLADFKKKQETANEINKFVADSTDNQIVDLISPGIITKKTKMILVNAINFEKQWPKPFTKQSIESIFYNTENVVSLVSMMEKMEKDFCYHRSKTYQFLQIPYEGENFPMFILLPQDRFGLNEIIKNIEISEILNLMSNASFSHGNVIIPIFKVESSFGLKEILLKLGINDAFDEELADFSGISDNKDICVSDVIHKAIIKVDEKGTKAAAATAVRFIELCGELRREPTFHFVADHPFLYFIADKEKNIYFIGTFFN